MRSLGRKRRLVVEMTTPRKISKDLLPRLRAQLALKGLTQLDLANRLGHPVSTVGSWLRGVGRAPADLVPRIERALRLPQGTLSYPRDDEGHHDN